MDGIQLQGGTMLGTSRGGADMKEIIRKLSIWGISHLYVIGGK